MRHLAGAPGDSQTAKRRNPGAFSAKLNLAAYRAWNDPEFLVPTASPIFDRLALDRLATAYPLVPVVMRHGLVEHPLLSLAALNQAATRMAAEHVEVRAAATAVGGPFGERNADPATGGWTMLRFIDQLPDYHTLLAGVLADVGPVVTTATSTPNDLRGFAFISAPRAVTPYHFDPEYNLLFQISGTKQFAVLPAQPPFLPDTAHHALHVDGNNILQWQDAFAAQAHVFTLTPGDALFVPYKAPHWVVVGEASSVSLSVTWQSNWTLAQRDAHRLNAQLQRLGLATSDLPQWPKRPCAHSQAGFWTGSACCEHRLDHPPSLARRNRSGGACRLAGAGGACGRGSQCVS